MPEVLAVSLIQVAIALLYRADRRRGVARWPLLETRPSAHAMRGLAALLIAMALLLWNAAEPGPAAFLAVPVALMVAGTLGTLLAAFWPRLSWVLLIAAAPLVALLVTIAGSP
ncbi:MAG: hypothetical protein RL033_2143 [Pseudomonadota bacterium]